MCGLAMFNLGDLYGADAGSVTSMSGLSLGKVFLRAYPFAMTFAPGSTTVTIAMTGPQDNSEFILDVCMITITVFLMLVFVFWMTHKRKQRYEKERSMFFKLKEL